MTGRGQWARKARATAMMTMLLAGCAGKTPGWTDTGWKGAVDAPAANKGPASLGAAPKPLTPTVQFAGAEASTPGESMVKAASAVKEALVIKPRVIPVEDPISLVSDNKPIGPEVNCRAAQLFESQGLADKAEEQYRRALAAEPTHLYALAGLARLCDRQGRLEEAIALYRQAVAAHPSQAVLHNDLGLCYARSDQWSKSIESLERAVLLDARSKLYRNNIATVLIEVDRVDDALEHLLAAHSPAEAHYNAGYLLYRRGQGEAAERYFSEALRIDPQLHVARKMLDRLTGRTAVATAPQESVYTLSDNSAPLRRTPLVSEASEIPLRLPEVASSSEAADENAAEAPLPGDEPSLLPPVD